LFIAVRKKKLGTLNLNGRKNKKVELNITLSKLIILVGEKIFY